MKEEVQYMKRLITRVDKYSIAADFGIEVGDKLVAKNGTADFDIFDYYMAIAGSHMNLLIEKPDGTQFLFDFEKDEDEDVGLGFETKLMDQERVCENKCVFCHVEQQPKDILHKSEYRKIDDYRTSFIDDGYTTMTNMSKHDVARIIEHRISPTNISVHTTDPDLRIKMLGNRNAGKSLKHMKRLADGGIKLGMRVVLCKGVNDGKHLDKPISDLGKLVPKGVNGGGFSLGIVPGRITQFRKKNDMPVMEQFTEEDCIQIVRQIEEWQMYFLKELGTHFVYPSDEFYAIAGIKVPRVEVYEEFLQFRNGVGSMALFADEFAYATRDGLLSPKMKITVVTGMATANFMREITDPYENVSIAAIENNFYGKNVLHTSHLAGRDIIDQLKGKPLGDVLLLSARCLRYGKNVLVDGVTVLEISQELGVEVMTIVPTGGSFAKALRSL